MKELYSFTLNPQDILFSSEMGEMRLLLYSVHVLYLYFGNNFIFSEEKDSGDGVSCPAPDPKRVNNQDD